MMFQDNSFIKWAGQDESGNYEYTGQFKGMHGDTVIFQTDQGTMGIHKDDGSFTSVKKPKGWNVKPEKTIPTAVRSDRPKRSKGGITKLDQVIKLLDENPDLINNRKAAIEKIVERVGMTPAGASTYYSKAKTG